MTMSEAPSPYWGTILKSNSNGTYFGISIENVNRDDRGYVDFEKMIGLDGIALINVVSNTNEAVVTGQKALQTRITHNDGECFAVSIFGLSSYSDKRPGSTWKKLVPPQKDSLGNKYDCDTTVSNTKRFVSIR